MHDPEIFTKFADIMNHALSADDITALRKESGPLYRRVSRFLPCPPDDSENWQEKALAGSGETCDACGARAVLIWHRFTFCRHCYSVKIPEAQR